MYGRRKKSMKAFEQVLWMKSVVIVEFYDIHIFKQVIELVMPD